MTMLYKIDARADWDNADGTVGAYQTTLSVRAVSRKHALDKAAARVQALPCYADRRAEGLRVDADVTILEEEGPVTFADFPECPQCSYTNGPENYLGVLGRLAHVRCRACGWTFAWTPTP